MRAMVGAGMALAPPPRPSGGLVGQGMAGRRPRRLRISPAVGGRDAWDLDIDGPLNLGAAGGWSITPLADIWVTARIWGGGGGDGTGSGSDIGGNGGFSSGQVRLRKGRTYTLVIGAGGGSPAGGAPGGGTGGITYMGGGGGYSAIWLGPVLLAIVGGGGGASNQTGLTASGADGGGVTPTGGNPSYPGAYLQGASGVNYGGGGGGGYVGGNGATGDGTSTANPGGGGSSWANPAETRQFAHTVGYGTDPVRAGAGAPRTAGRIHLS